MKITASARSQTGGREYNDDTALIRQEADSTWVYVGDGLGSYAGGKQASQHAGEALMALTGRESMLGKETLEKAVTAADEAVKLLQRQTEDYLDLVGFNRPADDSWM